jgi:hypothetical protein
MSKALTLVTAVMAVAAMTAMLSTGISTDDTEQLNMSARRMLLVVVLQLQLHLLLLRMLP